MSNNIHLRAISQKIPQPSITKINLKITYLKFHSNLPEAYYPDIKIHGADMGPTWVLSAPDGSHVGPMNLAIRVANAEVTTVTLGIIFIIL